MSKNLNLSVSLMAVIASSMTMIACAKNSGSSAAPEAATTPVAAQAQVKPSADAAGCPNVEDGAYELKSEAGHTDATNRLHVSTTTDGAKAFAAGRLTRSAKLDLRLGRYTAVVAAGILPVFLGTSIAKQAEFGYNSKV